MRGPDRAAAAPRESATFAIRAEPGNVASIKIREEVPIKLCAHAQQNASKLLAAIPLTLRLEAVPAKESALWEAIDDLFASLYIPKIFATSRIAKVFCRKRPALIPMLDSVIQEYLNGIAKEWARGKRGAPPWFLPVWTKWTGQISPYLRMIRHDIRGQAEALRSVRVKVAAADGTGVPPSAPLLRIYEAAVFRGRRGRWPAVR